MEFVRCDEIVIPENRIRKEFNKNELEGLCESILSKGLLHAIVLRNDGRTLVAGERRLRAIRHIYSAIAAEASVMGAPTPTNTKLLYPYIKYDALEVQLGMVPCVRLKDLNETQLMEAELEENIVRTDLTWQERTSAIAKLHKLRDIQTGGKQTMSATAREITGESLENRGQQVANVSDALLVAEHLDDPDIAAAPSLKEAKKLLTVKLDKLFRQALGSLPQDTSLHKLIHGRCEDELSQYNETFDCIVTDPPYLIGADKFGSQATTKHEYADGESALDYPTIIRLLARSTKPQAHIYMFCDPRMFSILQSLFESENIAVWPVPLIWYKSTGMLPEPDFGPRRCYETILFANKGRKRTLAVYGDVLAYSPVDEKTHAAEKPLDLYCDLLRRSCIPGDHVLDAFCGSGVIFPAANKLQLIATGIDTSKDACNLAAMRLNSLV